jgi:hypothetical protein
MDALPDTIYQPGEVLEIHGHVMLQPCGSGTKVIRLPAVVKRVTKERTGPVLRHRRIEPASD